MESGNKVKLSLISLVIGFIHWGIFELLFNLLTQKMYTPTGIGIYLLSFGLILAGFFCIYGFFQVDMNKTENFGDSKGAIKAITFILVLIFITTFSFEYLYELGKNSISNPTSYIFLIDDSGSMETNDPNNMRGSAINEIMKQSSDLPYAVYSFDEDASLIKQMGTYSSDDYSEFKFESTGGTDILAAIKTVTADYINGNLYESGDYPRIILLSDGGSSTKGTRKVINDCKNNGITVCSVGFGGCNKLFLSKLANLTGGSYVYCDDVSILSSSMKKAAEENFKRNLLSDRFVLKNDFLYCFLRIFFLSIIGLEWSLLKFFSIRNFSNCTISLIFRFSILCIIGAFIMEFLSKIVATSLVRLLFCLLWALMIGISLYQKKPSHIKSSSFTNSSGFHPNDSENVMQNKSTLGESGVMNLNFGQQSNEQLGIGFNNDKPFNSHEFGGDGHTGFGSRNNSAFGSNSGNPFKKQ